MEELSKRAQHHGEHWSKQTALKWPLRFSAQVSELNLSYWCEEERPSFNTQRDKLQIDLSQRLLIFSC
ncbi:Hypothetical protein SMAX5B_008822 [Scophthalmus maximus]|uniref:Uncharacterized protein n=1 Tax=Scophthalmus maximus TaxID=52904 RepID=A0A2U9C6Q6_SCOMX|nr:Hypothetical protein SMAX5B_008822 [Scophthalmus maximus]